MRTHVRRCNCGQQNSCCCGKRQQTHAAGNWTRYQSRLLEAFPSLGSRPATPFASCPQSVRCAFKKLEHLADCLRHWFYWQGKVFCFGMHDTHGKLVSNWTDMKMMVGIFYNDQPWRDFRNPRYLRPKVEFCLCYKTMFRRWNLYSQFFSAYNREPLVSQLASWNFHANQIFWNMICIFHKLEYYL